MSVFSSLMSEAALTAPANDAARPSVEGNPCPHFGICGGCQIQDVPYPKQLERKAGFLTGLLKPLGWDQPVRIHPSPDIWYYRNKMEFSFQDVYPAPPQGEDYLLLGFKRKKRWDKVLNISECRLLSPQAPALVAAVHAWARAEGLAPYNLHRRQGFLRHLVVREARGAGGRMVLLVTTPGELPGKSFVSAVRSAYPATTILRGIHAGLADVAKGERTETLHGPGAIIETLLGRSFRISPHTFFQTNTAGAAVLYGRIRDWLKEIGPKSLLDLYCGSGAISLCVSDLCGRVLGVEAVPSAVQDARANAAANRVSNAEFTEAKVEDVLPALVPRGLEADAVILDPPRSGLHPAALKALRPLSPRWVVYVSCNPVAMVRDLELLSDFYALERAEAVDLFPHTEHVEALALLRRRSC